MSRSSVGVKGVSGARKVILNSPENLIIQEWKYLENNDNPKVDEAAST